MRGREEGRKRVRERGGDRERGRGTKRERGGGERLLDPLFHHYRIKAVHSVH